MLGSRLEVTPENKENTAETNSSDIPFGDIPSWIWRSLVWVWGIFCVSLWILFGHAPSVDFVLVVVSAFALAYFLLPYMLVAIALRESSKAKAFGDEGRVSTFTGAVTSSEAAVQILMVPALVMVVMVIAVVVTLLH